MANPVDPSALMPLSVEGGTTRSTWGPPETVASAAPTASAFPVEVSY